MRIGIACLGTRGDVLPFVVLGRGLQAAGHDVRISTTERVRGLVEGAALGFHGLPGDPADVFRAGRIDMSPWRPVQHIKRLGAAIDALVCQTDPELLADAWADRDLVIFAGATTFGYYVARRLGLPSAMVIMTPAPATRAFAHPVLGPRRSLGPLGNRASWGLADILEQTGHRAMLKRAVGVALQLPTAAGTARRRGGAWPPFPLINAFSPAIVPRPPDWSEHVSITGWLLPERSLAPLPDDVERFLADGDLPIYVGFGSMPIPDPEHVARMLLGALRQTGRRAIVCGAELARTTALSSADTVLTAEELPHERLLERVAAVVHHGGSGTTGAALRAGRPTLVTPFVFDQFFWGQRIKHVGAGPAALPFRWLSEDRLARRLADLTSGRYDAAARRIGERIRAEDSVGRAVEAIERAGRLSA